MGGLVIAESRCRAVDTCAGIANRIARHHFTSHARHHFTPTTPVITTKRCMGRALGGCTHASAPATSAGAPADSAALPSSAPLRGMQQQQHEVPCVTLHSQQHGTRWRMPRLVEPLQQRVQCALTSPRCDPAAPPHHHLPHAGWDSPVSAQARETKVFQAAPCTRICCVACNVATAAGSFSRHQRTFRSRTPSIATC